MKTKITLLFAILSIATAAQAQWSLTGNAGTNPAVNFIGTTDAQPIVFKTNNWYSGILDPNNFNAAIGWRSFEYNTTGTNNTAFGKYTLFWNGAGTYNTAIGAD